MVTLHVVFAGDMSVPLSGLVVVQPATDEVQQPAAAAPRVDVGDTLGGTLGIVDLLSAEFGPGT